MVYQYIELAYDQQLYLVTLLFHTCIVIDIYSVGAMKLA